MCAEGVNGLRRALRKGTSRKRRVPYPLSARRISCVCDQSASPFVYGFIHWDEAEWHHGNPASAHRKTVRRGVFHSTARHVTAVVKGKNKNDQLKGRYFKMKKVIAFALSLMMILSLISLAGAEEKTTFKVGICNLVSDPSLNQIDDNIQKQLNAIAAEKNVTIEILAENCNFDFAVLDQIIADFIADDVDLMIGIATPVASAMARATAENGIPVVFAAVSDPEGSELVESNDAPGANVTGTSDALNTNALLDLIFAFNPDAKTIGLLYNASEDASTLPIATAKEALAAKGVAYKEYTGTNTTEIQQIVESLILDGVDAVFTPTDNTIQVAEPAIYEALAEAKIPHYAGADSFALVGAFVGYGVDYANLGKETANMAAAILLDGADPATLPVMTFDNGKATVNLEVCETLGVNYDDVAATFAPYCTMVESIETGEAFAE